MKRAPIIPRSISNDAHADNAPAAPMVDALISRVGALTKGNTIHLPVCGREVKFTLETISADEVSRATSVWAGNERDQGLLNESSLNDLIPSFLSSGQQTPALGRKFHNIIEVADGSRRRMAAIITGNEYRILIGDLDDEQMDALCRLGNDYRPTSSYERGKRYTRLLQEKFNNNVSALAQSENLSRISIIRCLNAAKLPYDVVKLFSHPGELSARAGEQLADFLAKNEKLMLSNLGILSKRKDAGETFEPDEILRALQAKDSKTMSKTSNAVKRQFSHGAYAKYQGDKVTINLDKSLIPSHVITRIESILSELDSPLETNNS